jgi:hypothetical protein
LHQRPKLQQIKILSTSSYLKGRTIERKLYCSNPIRSINVEAAPDTGSNDTGGSAGFAVNDDGGAQDKKKPVKK